MCTLFAFELAGKKRVLYLADIRIADALYLQM
jgi:hypothetical protein